MDRLFGVNGLLGFFLLVVVLLSVVFGLGFQALKTQKIQATQSYVLETQAIEPISVKNQEYYKTSKEIK